MSQLKLAAALLMIGMVGCTHKKVVTPVEGHMVCGPPANGPAGSITIACVCTPKGATCELNSSSSQ